MQLGNAQHGVVDAVAFEVTLSLLYPHDPITGYSREAFLNDLTNEAEAEIRGCLDAGAHRVQLDFTGPGGRASWTRPA